MKSKTCKGVSIAGVKTQCENPNPPTFHQNQSYCKHCKKRLNAYYNKRKNPLRKKKLQDNDAVYILSNKAWEGFHKVGYSSNLYTRLSDYNVSSPFRDFEYLYTLEADNAEVIETAFHDRYKRGHGEWYEVPVEELIRRLKGIQEELKKQLKINYGEKEI